MPVGAGGPAGRRDAVPMPAASGPEAERARGASCWTGPYPGSSGPCGAAFGGGREELDRRLGAGTDPWRETPGERVSAADRGSKFRFLEWVEGQTAAAVTATLTRRPGPVRDRVHTGTADNGKEFARHREIAQKLDAGFYFATPYPSWERGRNEHPHGRVREYFPKGTDCRQVPPTLRALR